MTLFHGPDGKTIIIQIENGMGKIWVYDKDGKCTRCPTSEKIARSKRQTTDDESPTEEGATEGQPTE